MAPKLSSQQQYAYQLGRLEALKLHLDTWRHLSQVIGEHLKRVEEATIESAQELEASKEGMLSTHASAELLRQLTTGKKG